MSESDTGGALAQTHYQDAFGNTQSAWATGLWGGDRAGWHHNTLEYAAAKAALIATFLATSVLTAGGASLPAGYAFVLAMADLLLWYTWKLAWIADKYRRERERVERDFRKDWDRLQKELLRSLKDCIIPDPAPTPTPTPSPTPRPYPRECTPTRTSHEIYA